MQYYRKMECCQHHSGEYDIYITTYTRYSSLLTNGQYLRLFDSNKCKVSIVFLQCHTIVYVASQQQYRISILLVMSNLPLNNNFNKGIPSMQYYRKMECSQHHSGEYDIYITTYTRYSSLLTNGQYLRLFDSNKCKVSIVFLQCHTIVHVASQQQYRISITIYKTLL